MKNKDVEKLLEHLNTDPSLKDEDKKILLKRAEVSQKISDILKEMKVTPLEVIRILIGMACGVTTVCDQPYKAISFILQNMAEYYDYYETVQKVKKSNDKDDR